MSTPLQVTANRRNALESAGPRTPHGKAISRRNPPPPPPTPPPVAKPPAATEDDIAVFFSPRGGAMAAILDEIGRAQRTVDVNAYLVTSRAIVDALEAAQGRGVQVRIVLDKNN